MTEVTLRIAEGSDVRSTVEVWNRSLVRDPVTEARFATWLFADPDHDVSTGEGAWVAELEGKIVGFVRATKRVFPNDLAGREEEHGWIPVLFVDPGVRRHGVGTALLERAVEYHREHATRHVWVCGNTGSAPGYLFPGVDLDAYPGAHALFVKHGFVIDHEPVAMARTLADVDLDKLYREAWTEGSSEGVQIEALRPETVQEFLAFLRDAFPGDWNTAARSKLRSGPMDEVLIARLNGTVVGYCQWEGEHFGPTGVQAEARGKRLGAKLFVEAMRRIRLAGGNSIWFNWADPDAARFYHRFGLEVTRRYAILRKDL